MIYRVTFRGLLEGVCFVQLKDRRERFIIYDGTEFILIVVYFLTDLLQVFRTGHPVTCSEEAISRCEVDVVAWLIAIPPDQGKVDAKIIFIRAFVFAEADVAIDTKQVLLRRISFREGWIHRLQDGD